MNSLQVGMLLVLFCQSVAASERSYTVTYSGSQVPGELSCEAHYYLWLPENVQTIRAVIVHQHGCGDGAERGCLAAAEDLHWQALARQHSCALLGTSYRAGDANCGAWAEPRSGSQITFERALTDFAAQSGHPELATVPWCLWGHSGGGWWASTMLTLQPERCVAVWLRSGTAYGEQPAETVPAITPAALQVPVMCNPGELERTDERFRKAYTDGLAMFHKWREQGAHIAFAADPKANHDCGGSRYLAIAFFHSCLTARLPETTGEPLRPMPADGVYLGSLESEVLTALESFEGETADTVWLPNAGFAAAWSHYRKNATIPDSTPPPAPFEVALRSGVLSWKTHADLESGLRGFVIERGGTVIATLPDKPSETTLFQGLSYHDTPSQPVPLMEFRDPASLAGATYRVIAINTAGLQSTATEATVIVANTEQ